LGRFTNDTDIDYVLEKVGAGVNHMRDLSPIWEMYKVGIDLNAIEWSEH
jgi:cysteine desulfurase